MNVRRLTSDPGWPVPLAFLAGAGFELAFALGAGRSSVTRGDQPPGSSIVEALALGGLALGLLGSGARATGRWRLDSLTFAAPAFAALELAFELTYDPYYAPTLQRYSANVPAGWFVVVAVVGAVPVVARRFGPRPSAATTLVALPVLLVLLAGNGH